MYGYHLHFTKYRCVISNIHLFKVLRNNSPKFRFYDFIDVLFCKHKSNFVFKQCSSNTNNGLIYFMHIQHFLPGVDMMAYFWQIVLQKVLIFKFTFVFPTSAIPNISWTYMNTYLRAVIIGTCTFIHILSIHMYVISHKKDRKRNNILLLR